MMKFTNLRRIYSIIAILSSFLIIDSTTAQSYWAASGGYILNVQTGETFAGSVGVRGALTEAHDDADTQDGHTLMFMPAGLNIYSTDVFDTDHDYSSITKEITIDGNGATVSNDGPTNNTSAAIWLQPGSGSTQTVRNITLCGFTHTNGSALKNNANTDSKIILENVNVYYSGNNSYQVWLEGSCDIINCDFSNVQQTSNTGGLNIVLNGQARTVNIVNSTFNCNRKDGFGSSVFIGNTGTYYAHTVNISGGSISNNISNYHPFSTSLCAGSVINIDGMSFINNQETGTGAEANVIYNYDPGTGYPTMNVTNCLFVNNTGNEDIIKSSSSARLNYHNNIAVQGTGNTMVFDNSANDQSATDNVMHGNYSFDGGNTNTTKVGTTITDVGTYYVPGYSTASACGGVCTPSEPAQETQISFEDCFAPNGTLTSNVSAEWFYQLEGGSPVSLGTGTTATIPNISGYVVIWQDVGTGTDPIMAGEIDALPGMGSNTNSTPIPTVCLGSISGNVFQDGDATVDSADGVNGTGPVDDTNLSGVTVHLVDDLGTILMTTTTDANGNYEFYNIPEGDYTVQFVAPAGMVSTTSADQGNTMMDSDAITMPVTGGVTIVSSPTITIDLNPDASASSYDDSFSDVGHYVGIGVGFVVDAAAILPVTYSSFKVTEHDCKAVLNWSTSSETNHSHFEVERKIGKGEFYKIGLVKESFESRNDKNYTFTDEAPSLLENNYYRLKQVDLDGVYAHSAIYGLSLDCTRDHGVMVSPNPFSESLNMVFDNANISNGNTVSVEMYNLLGKKILSRDLIYNDAAPSVRIPTMGLEKGVYVLRVQTNSTILHTQKVMKF